MKLFRYVKHDGVYPGMVDSSGQLRDISAHVDDVSRACLSDTELARLCELDEHRLPLISTPVRYLPPISDISKFIAIGLNYLDHAEEAGLAIPSEPLVFFKPVSCISGADDPIVQPPHSRQLDWEVELGVVIGKRARYVPVAQALEHVAGYCVANDVSDRGFQFQSSQWDKGKSSDSFGPLGPWLVTRDEVPDPQSLPMWLEVNGQRRQEGNTQTMIFSVAEIISYCSHYMTLDVGDVIITGTPPGVSMGMKPHPEWLEPGDEVVLSICGLGVQRHVVMRYEAEQA
ncbi:MULTISPECIES: fumarylacetoacetate hydrolase family protein [Pseudomonas]|uniref:Fumarylacetoacetate hydrolase family protein n=1 Tax=Pseudomonas bubulae TaxID=2316085 RepID=A0ABZ2H2R8_9PSED|nr:MULTISPECIES: fumarylacetoacetate hydrolase family protein [unclassified Pseudomonas]MCH4885589.1 FAA hydrolase family protein [Pseudomonas sp. TMW22080]HBP48462.1 2-hydroxyhepta-2,4-diene-1,7-dioate isomerase [Pseudomonas sp.]